MKVEEQEVRPGRLGALLGFVGVLLLLLLARISFLGSNVEALAAAKGVEVQVFSQNVDGR